MTSYGFAFDDCEMFGIAILVISSVKVAIVRVEKSGLARLLDGCTFLDSQTRVTKIAVEQTIDPHVISFSCEVNFDSDGDEREDDYGE
jgi:hypothetical protein